MSNPISRFCKRFHKNFNSVFNNHPRATICPAVTCGILGGAIAMPATPGGSVFFAKLYGTLFCGAIAGTATMYGVLAYGCCTALCNRTIERNADDEEEEVSFHNLANHEALDINRAQNINSAYVSLGAASTTQENSTIVNLSSVSSPRGAQLAIK